MKDNYTTIDGEFVARYFKYFLQLKNPYVVYKLSVNKVSVKNFYEKHHKYFSLLAEICNRYHIDVVKYLDFFINKLNKFEKDIDTSLVTIMSLNKYVEHLQIAKDHERIYKVFLRSVDNIVQDCISLNFNSTIDYLRYLITNRMLATYYVSGKISTYYFAAIPNFKKVIDKLDALSKDEFMTLYDRYDKYHSDVNEAFLKMKNIKINPIKYTDDAILKTKNV